MQSEKFVTNFFYNR